MLNATSRPTDFTSAARAMVLARLGVGAVLVLAPGLVLSPWVGRDVARLPAAKMLARAVGGRDLALGIGGWLAVSRSANESGAGVRGWIEAGALCDLGDAVATALAARHLPRLGAAGGITAALATAAAGRAIASGLGRSPARP